MNPHDLSRGLKSRQKVERNPGPSLPAPGCEGQNGDAELLPPRPFPAQCPGCLRKVEPLAEFAPDSFLFLPYGCVPLRVSRVGENGIACSVKELLAAGNKVRVPSVLMWRNPVALPEFSEGRSAPPSAWCPRRRK